MNRTHDNCPGRDHDAARQLIVAAPRQAARSAEASAEAESGLVWAQLGLDLTTSVLPSRLDRTWEQVRLLVDQLGVEGGSDPGTLHEILLARSRRRGWSPVGSRSANGTCCFLPAANGWIAANLARPDDRSAVNAWLEADVTADDDASLAKLTGRHPTAWLVERARLLGLPVAALGLDRDEQLMSRNQTHCDTPFLAWSGAGPVVREVSAETRVLDLSSMWAGPLCARTLACAGMAVTRVESQSRRDGFLLGDPEFYSWLNGTKTLRVLDLADAMGRALLIDAIRTSDVVISSARPRVFAQWGVDVTEFVDRGGAWVSITGYGWSGADTAGVAFGDDAAVAGGLYRKPCSDGTPEFIGDAMGDPISGITAAWAALLAVSQWRAGDGHRTGVFIDVAMREAVRWHNGVDGVDGIDGRAGVSEPDGLGG